jgi:hypothetical protein
MVTNRTPKNRPPGLWITPEAVEIFTRMMQIEDGEASEEWWELDWQLHAVLKLPPWQGCPTVIIPGQAPTHPIGSGGGDWERNGGPALFRALCEKAGIAD